MAASQKNLHATPAALRAASGCSAGLHVGASLLIAGVVAVLTPSAHADEAVSDASAQAVARKILEDYKVERKLNVPRWADLAHDENTGKQADCPVPIAGTKPPVSFNDCNLAYFELRKERWQDVMQSWAVLDSKQKSDLAKTMAPIFGSLAKEPSMSLAGQTVAKAYSGSSSATAGSPGSGSSGIAALLGALGLTVDDGAEKMLEAMLKPSFGKGGDFLKSILSAHSQNEIADLSSSASASVAKFKSVSPQVAEGMAQRLKTVKYTADTQKNLLAETGNVATNSKSRADAVKDITAKIQALGNSSADQSLVSAQLAQYEFYLAALDALGREELIKVAAQRQGDRAQTKLMDSAFEAKLWNNAIQRASK